MYQQQQYQQQDNSDMFTSEQTGTYGEPEKEILKIIISVNELMDRFEHETLRGEYQIVDPVKGLQWVKLDPKRKIINDIGIAEIKARLSGIVNEKTPLSFTSEEDYYKDMSYFHMSVAEMFGKRSSARELDDEMAKPIVDAMIELAKTVLSMSKEGFTAKNFNTQYQKHDIQRYDSANQSQGKSLFGLPIGGK